MTITVTALDLAGLKKYSEVNPVKFAHKYGVVDFNNLPEGFEGKMALYKGMVARERARRDEVGASQETPEITPWTMFPAVVQEAVATGHFVGQSNDTGVASSRGAFLSKAPVKEVEVTVEDEPVLDVIGAGEATTSDETVTTTEEVVGGGEPKDSADKDDAELKAE